MDEYNVPDGFEDRIKASVVSPMAFDMDMPSFGVVVVVVLAIVLLFVVCATTIDVYNLKELVPPVAES